MMVWFFFWFFWPAGRREFVAPSSPNTAIFFPAIKATIGLAYLDVSPAWPLCFELAGVHSFFSFFLFPFLTTPPPPSSLTKKCLVFPP